MLSRIFQNGRNPLNWASALLVTATAFLVIAWAATLLINDEKLFAPLTIEHLSIDSRVEGVEGPAVRVRQSYRGTIMICNNNDKQHTITFIIEFERLFGSVTFKDGGTVEFAWPPGCDTIAGESPRPLPNDVTPGLWREATTARIEQGDQIQTLTFKTEPFEVVP